MIKNERGTIRIDLNEQYTIIKRKNSKYWWLEYYNFGRNYMPIELRVDQSLMKVYKYYREVK